MCCKVKEQSMSENIEKKEEGLSEEMLDLKVTETYDDSQIQVL